MARRGASSGGVYAVFTDDGTPVAAYRYYDDAWLRRAWEDSEHPIMWMSRKDWQGPISLSIMQQLNFEEAIVQ